MLEYIDNMISNIEDAPAPMLSLVPFKLVEVFADYYTPMIGRLMLELKAKKVNFDFKEEAVEDYETAFRLVKEKKDYGEKILYAIRFLGLFNKATKSGTERFINTLLGKETQ